MVPPGVVPCGSHATLILCLFIYMTTFTFYEIIQTSSFIMLGSILKVFAWSQTECLYSDCSLSFRNL